MKPLDFEICLILIWLREFQLLSLNDLLMSALQLSHVHAPLTLHCHLCNLAAENNQQCTSPCKRQESFKKEEVEKNQPLYNREKKDF